MTEIIASLPAGDPAEVNFDLDSIEIERLELDPPEQRYPYQMTEFSETARKCCTDLCTDHCSDACTSVTCGELTCAATCTCNCSEFIC